MALSECRGSSPPSQKEWQSLSAALDKWEDFRTLLARTSLTAVPHWQNGKEQVDPPYWSDFLHSTDDVKRTISKALQGVMPAEAPLAVFILADRLMGRSRFCASRAWYLSSRRYIINAREFAALQQLIAYILGPQQAYLTRIDRDRAMIMSGGCCFPLYISATVSEHSRFATSRERFLYPCDFLAYPIPDATFYQVQPGGAIDVCQGVHLSVSVESPGAIAMSPSATNEELQRYIQKAQRMELVAFVGKNLGSLDAKHPYSQSSTVVMVDDADMVEKILQVSDELSLGLRTDDVTHLGRSAVFPFSFPPALCDEDRLLQQALMETGNAFATSSAAQGFATATLAQHGIDSRSLLDVGEGDFEKMLHFDDTEDEVLTRARDLVANAMKQLRRVEAVSRWISEDLLCQDLLDQVWRELKLKAEWSEISDRWSQKFEPPSRKSKNKKTRQKEKDGSSEAIDPEKLAMRLQQAVVDMDKKDYFDRRLEDGPRVVLHGPGVRSVSFVRPHGCSKPDGRPPKISA
ncbi:unnamed protein product [Symbiodinium sp. KB8]|nr:unnamed protein product [Symbiodinium sp. KB8]